MEATATATLTRSLSLLLRRRSHASFHSTAAPAARDVHRFRRASSDAGLVLAAATSSAELLRSPRPRILEEEDAVPMDHGAGLGGKGGSGRGGGRGTGGQSQSESGMGMGEHYRRVLRVEPDNPLLLRNYGRYLHDVEGDLAGAEEYYARALLADADAELLSLYGRVLWEAGRDKERAAAYLERAVQAAPDDCYVLGSYASFLWDADDAEAAAEEAAMLPSPELVPAC